MKITFKSFHPPGQCKGCPFNVQRPVFPNIGPASPTERLCLLGYTTAECFRYLGGQHIHKGCVMLHLNVPDGQYCISLISDGLFQRRCAFLDARRDDMHLPIYSKCNLYNCVLSQEGKLLVPIKAPVCLAQALFKGSKEEP